MGYQLPPQKHHPHFLAKPPLNQQTVQAPLFRQSSLYIGFSRHPPKKSDLSVNPQNIKVFSSLIPSCLLKVTKSLGKISQFELLIMTEKDIFAYKLFLSLNISDFNLFLWENCIPPPPWKKLSPLSQQPPLKAEVLPRPPFWKFGWRLNPPLQKAWGVGGGCPLCIQYLFIYVYYYS